MIMKIGVSDEAYLDKLMQEIQGVTKVSIYRGT